MGWLFWSDGGVRKALNRIEAKLNRILAELRIPQDSVVDVLSEQVKGLARDPSRKIEAIKCYREETGAGLMEAKDAIEDYIRTLN